MVVTTDGSISSMPRADYVEAEQRVVSELQQLGKPFIVVLNTSDIYSIETQKLQLALEEKYDVPVIPVDVLNMSMEDLRGILERVLFEFPLRRMNICMPKWMQALPSDHELIAELLERVKASATTQGKMRDYPSLLNMFEDSQTVTDFDVENVDLGSGTINYSLQVAPELFYKVLGDECGCEIKGDFHLISLMRELMQAKREYDRVSDALAACTDCP